MVIYLSHNCEFMIINFPTTTRLAADPQSVIQGDPRSPSSVFSCSGLTPALTTAATVGSTGPQNRLQGDQIYFPDCRTRSGSALRYLTRVLTLQKQGLRVSKSHLSLLRKPTFNSPELSHQNLPFHPELIPPQVFSLTRIVRV